MLGIALEVPTATSILNVLPATITGLADDHGGGLSVVRLQVGVWPCWRTLPVNRHCC